MPNISKINAVDIGNIAKVDGATSSTIAKVDGLDFVTFTGLIDTYTGAAAGYSVRRLATSATVLLRVRRDTAGGTGDSDEADVAYDSNNILSLDSAISNASVGVTATTLGQFLNVGTVGGTTYTNPDSLSGTASCFVDEWKDQSGNAKHASQATFANQPQIHSGTVNTDLITENGKPTIKLEGSSTVIIASGFSSLTEGELYTAVRWLGDTATRSGWKISTQSQDMHFPYLGGNVYDNFGSTSRRNFSPSVTLNQLNLYNTVSTSSEWTARLNGNIERTSATNTVTFSNDLNIGASLNGPVGHNFSEFILFDNSKSTSDRSGIETDMSTYFSTP